MKKTKSKWTEKWTNPVSTIQINSVITLIGSQKNSALLTQRDAITSMSRMKSEGT